MLAAKIALPILPLLAAAGCARAPSGAESTTGPQVIVSMTVAHRIRPDYFYFVLFNVSSASPPTSVGPIPVVGTPWGNGFAQGDITGLVRYDAAQGNTHYGVYSVVPGTNNRQFTPLGSPLQYTVVGDTGNTIQFRIPLSQLATAGISVDQIQSLQINFVATNAILEDANTSATKLFDALGDARQVGGVNNPITISATTSRIYQNSDSLTQEPSGDVTQAGNGVFQNTNEPDLDIVNWTVEIRN